MPDAAERRRYMEEEFGVEAFLALSNLSRINLESRRMLANAIYNTVYKPVAERTGEFAGLSDDERGRVLDIVTLELISKVMNSIEDLGKVLIAADHPPKRTPGVLIGDTSATASFAVFGRLAKVSNKELRRVLALLEPGAYGLRGEELEALDLYYEHTTEVIRALLLHVDEFVPLHLDAYNKYRHGSAVAVGFVGTMVGDGIDRPVAILDDPTDLKKAKFVLTGETVVKRLLTMHQMVVDIAKLLVERRLQLAEYGGVPIPVFVVGVPEADGKLRYESMTIASMDPALRERAEAIGRRIFDAMERTTVTINLNVDVPTDKLAERVAYYRREWNPTVSKADGSAADADDHTTGR